MANLFVPHNTHIVPAWRLVTWALVACGGELPAAARGPGVASYGILVAVMLMTGRLVARETGSVGLGLAAMALVGTTSLMLTPADVVLRAASRCGRASASWRRSGTPSPTAAAGDGPAWSWPRSARAWPAGSGRPATWPVR